MSPTQMDEEYLAWDYALSYSKASMHFAENRASAFTPTRRRTQY